MDQVSNKEFGAYLVTLGQRMVDQDMSSSDVLYGLSSEEVGIGIKETCPSVDMERATQVAEMCKTTGCNLVPPTIEKAKLTVAVYNLSNVHQNRVSEDFGDTFELYFFSNASRMESVCLNFDRVFFVTNYGASGMDLAIDRARLQLAKTVAGPRLVEVTGAIPEELLRRYLFAWAQKQSTVEVALKPGEERCGFCGYVGPMEKVPGDWDCCPKCKGV